jgi:hypothetical protein
MRKSFLIPLLPILVLSLLGARRRATPPPEAPTFDNEIVRIFQQNCQTCHHPGDIAPFSLMTYPDSVAYADSIKYMTQTRQMPPWKAAQGCGDFVGVRTLSQHDIDLIARWVDSGAPEGNAADLPPAKSFDSGWSAGTPDLVLAMPKPFTPPADRDEYRCFSIPVQTSGDVQLSMLDFRPGDRGTVHHIIPYLDTTGASAKLDPNGNGYECFGGSLLDSATPMGGWSSGARPTPLPEGTALRIPKGSRVIMQVHYHPHFGRVAPDQTQIGIYAATGTISKQMHYNFIFNDNFVIPAGAADTRVDAFGRTGIDIEIVSIYPHMHLLGSSMKIEAQMPGAASQCMIEVPQYDFNWQGQYVYRTPFAIPSGGSIHVEAHFDNSTDNPRNPSSPPRDVRWGEATTDEMCVAMIGYTQANGQ